VGKGRERTFERSHNSRFTITPLVVNLVQLQVYHTEHPPLFGTLCHDAQVRQRQLILVFFLVVTARMVVQAVV